MLNRLREQAAQGLTEYGLILVLVAILLVLLLAILGEQISDTYQWIIDRLPV